MIDHQTKIKDIKGPGLQAWDCSSPAFNVCEHSHGPPEDLDDIGRYSTLEGQGRARREETLLLLLCFFTVPLGDAPLGELRTVNSM